MYSQGSLPCLINDVMLASLEDGDPGQGHLHQLRCESFGARALSAALSLPDQGNTGCLVQVRYLKVMEKSGYQALPWVRYITAGGEYEIR